MFDDHQENFHSAFDSQGCAVGQSASGWGPISSDLVTALAQKAAPILVSGSVWRNFIERRKFFKDLTQNYNQETIGYYQRNYRCFNNLQNLQYYKQQFDLYQTNPAKAVMQGGALANFYICANIPFDPNEWIMVQLTQSKSLYLVIPKKVIFKHTGKIPTQVSELNTNSVEKLGLNFKQKDFFQVTNLLNVDDFPQGGKDLQETIKTTKTTQVGSTTQSVTYTETVGKINRELIKTLKSLFVPKTTFESNPDSSQTWLVYLSGHGSQAVQGQFQTAQIAGLKETIFTTLLQFFNNYVQTKFLFYTTCYAGGEHLLKPYERTWEFPAQKPKGQKRIATRAELFNYTIAASTAFHTVSANFTGLSYSQQGQFITITINYPAHFDTFFTSLERFYMPQTGATGKKLDAILGYAHPFFMLQTQTDRTYLDTPLDKFIGTDLTDLYSDYQKRKYYIKSRRGNIYFADYLQVFVDYKNKQFHFDPIKRDPQLVSFRYGLDGRLYPTGGVSGYTLAIDKNFGEVFYDEQDKQYYVTRDMPKLYEMQVPAVRFPGTGWFSTLDLAGQVQRVTRVKAQAAYANKKSIASQGKQVVIFDTHSPLKRRKQDEEHAGVGSFMLSKKGTKTAPEIMMSASKEAKLYFESVATNYGFLELLNAFIPLQTYFYGRTYYLQELSGVNDLVQSDKQKVGAATDTILKLTDVIILNNARYPGSTDQTRYNGIFFTINGKQFAAYWTVGDAGSFNNLQQRKQLPSLQSLQYNFAYPYLQEDVEELKGFADVNEIIAEKKKKGPTPPQPTPTQPSKPKPTPKTQSTPKPGIPTSPKPKTKPTPPPRPKVKEPLVEKLEELYGALKRLNLQLKL